MARAIIGTNSAGTFGIEWFDFPALERHGGYSGPFRTVDEADQCARDWGAAFDEPIEVEHVGSLFEWNAEHRAELAAREVQR